MQQGLLHAFKKLSDAIGSLGPGSAADPGVRDHAMIYDFNQKSSSQCERAQVPHPRLRNTSPDEELRMDFQRRETPTVTLPVTSAYLKAQVPYWIQVV